MKKHINPFKKALLLAAFALPLVSLARNEDESEKKKTISKTYDVTANDKLSIENSFGDVIITNWDKNVIQVDVEMSATANTDEHAQSILDEIEVRENRSGNSISFKTDIGDQNDHGENHNKNKRDGNNRKFQINYTIHMPAANPIDIENQFGKIIMGDRKGEVNLTSKFGSLTTGKLDQVDEVDVEFGEASIGEVNNGKFTFKFNGKSAIERVSGSVKINSEFSGNVRFSVDNSISDLTINESYSNVKMAVSKDLSANFDIHTSFGNFNNSTDINIKEGKDEDDDNGPKFDKDYSGKAGDGKAKIKIKSSFGKVKLSNGLDKSDNDEGDEKVEKAEKVEKVEKKEKKEKKEKTENVTI